MPDYNKKKTLSNSDPISAKIVKRSDSNIAARANETRAKSDSISTTKKFMLDNKKTTDLQKTKAMSARAGNTAANETRKKTGVPKVTRFASIPSGGKMNNSRGQQDKYIRDKPIEKDFDRVKKSK